MFDASPSSWPGLSRPSMSLIPFVILDVDARDKRGHDESNIARIGISSKVGLVPKVIYIFFRTIHSLENGAACASAASFQGARLETFKQPIGEYNGSTYRAG